MQIAAEHLRQFIERIERLTDDKYTIAADIRDVFAEARSTGFDVKALREVIKIRKKSREEKEDTEAEATETETT